MSSVLEKKDGRFFFVKGEPTLAVKDLISSVEGFHIIKLSFLPFYLFWDCEMSISRPT